MKKISLFLLVSFTLSHANAQRKRDVDSVRVKMDTTYVWLAIVDTTTEGRLYPPTSGMALSVLTSLVDSVGNLHSYGTPIPSTVYYAIISAPGYEVRQMITTYTTSHGKRIEIVLFKHYAYLTNAMQRWPPKYHIIRIQDNQ